MWGEGRSLPKRPSTHSVNINFITEYIRFVPGENIITKVAQIHPGYLNPAIFVSVHEALHEVLSVELMNGEATRLVDYPAAVCRIKALADGAANQAGFCAQLRWWRVFAMFDRILFLVLKSHYSQAIQATRTVYELPTGLSGKCFGLYNGQEFLGLDGWYEQQTGFGADAPV